MDNRRYDASSASMAAMVAVFVSPEYARLDTPAWPPFLVMMQVHPATNKLVEAPPDGYLRYKQFVNAVLGPDHLPFQDIDIVRVVETAIEYAVPPGLAIDAMAKYGPLVD